MVREKALVTVHERAAVHQLVVEQPASRQKTLAMGNPETINNEMIRNFLGAWERRDTEYIMERFADDAV